MPMPVFLMLTSPGFTAGRGRSWFGDGAFGQLGVDSQLALTLALHFQAQLMGQALHDLMVRTDIAEQVRVRGATYASE